jgi:hypothetical protein
MKRIEITPISELDSVRDGEIFVRVPYGDNGTVRGYSCHLVNGNGLSIQMRMRPKEFRVPGTFRDEDLEIPQVGLDISRWLKESKGISVYGIDNCLVYERHLEQVPVTPEDLREAVYAFVQEVLMAYPYIAKKVKEYKARTLSEALKICERHADAV